ncbi:FAD-dependent oxidoreductase [Thermophilibacter immobilis]|uniref:FAD-dependent oxidoreductase n=1 Tax=Thermophilibacter immobilis TaxID=2779519 RepID=A0A7S7RUK4_9ACTN|nr:FAD-dependent oxidoreductase [Thermophilibacter immobilis]QOY61366.1 FAD-dependent oxidoreductase [Thermophilibacter immobilis]
MSDKIDEKNLYDAVIVGGGPSGLTAALYLARARYRVLVVEKDQFGGQITITDEVVNYPGVFSTSGRELTETMRRQAEAFGAEFLFAEVTGLDLSDDIKRVRTTKGELFCFAVLLATGASPREVGFRGEEEFKGHGVAYCATCDGEFFTGKQVFVVGGGFAAAEEGVFLTKYASHVTILVRGDDFTCAPAAAEAARRSDKIDVVCNAEVVEVSGDTALRRIVYRDRSTGETTTYEAVAGDTFGVFVFVGYAPATQLVSGVADVDEHGYVLTDSHQATSADGLFAAGDVCVKPLRQVATAVGQAATTATEMERYLKAAQERAGLTPSQPTSRPVAGAPTPAPAAEGVERAADATGLFDESMLAQLDAVFSRMASPLVLRLHLDERPVSAELSEYMGELASLTDLLSVEKADTSADDASELPFVEVCRADGMPSGLEFHGVPGGHEFTSFVLGLYNVSGPGQPIDDADRAAIAAVDSDVDVRVLVGLSCTMCPEVVVAAQRIAADSPHVTARVYDINHFGDLKDRYDVMSVPCLVVRQPDGTEQVSFGKKGLSQVLEMVG